MDDRKIVIDCDPGTDDALALLLVSVYLRERVLCLFSTYGNAALSHTHSNLLGLSHLLGLEGVPVVCGASCPLGKTGFVPTDYHGKNGLCGIELGISADVENSDGVDDVYDLIRENGRVVYIALGPLTNLARLLICHPDAVSMIDEVIIMGGGFAVGNTEWGAEYNFSLDPAAVSVVLGSSLKKVLAVLDFTHTLAFSEAEVEAIVGVAEESLQNDVRSAFDMMGRLFYRNLESSLRNGNEGAIIHDGAAVAYLCCRDDCTMEVKRVGWDHVGRLFESESGQKMNVIGVMPKEALAERLWNAFLSVKN